MEYQLPIALLPLLFQWLPIWILSKINHVLTRETDALKVNIPVSYEESFFIHFLITSLQRTAWTVIANETSGHVFRGSVFEIFNNFLMSLAKGSIYNTLCLCPLKLAHLNVYYYFYFLFIYFIIIYQFIFSL